MFCFNCGKKLAPNAKFCIFCGTRAINPEELEMENIEEPKPVAEPVIEEPEPVVEPVIEEEPEPQATPMPGHEETPIANDEEPEIEIMYEYNKVALSFKPVTTWSITGVGDVLITNLALGIRSKMSSGGMTAGIVLGGFVAVGIAAAAMKKNKGDKFKNVQFIGYDRIVNIEYKRIKGRGKAFWMIIELDDGSPITFFMGFDEAKTADVFNYICERIEIAKQ